MNNKPSRIVNLPSIDLLHARQTALSADYRMEFLVKLADNPDQKAVIASLLAIIQSLHSQIQECISIIDKNAKLKP